ncbi:MAG: hypothetical protein NC412_10870 [Roseburia sp.]|nr:hypothetical protein [Roseburia sp.]MCM1279323.1 hypothetical protein [Robinsoniella sp.]
MKMEYLRICQDKKMSNPFVVEGLDNQIYVANPSKEQFERLPKSMVTYFDYAPDFDVPDYIAAPTPMVSPKLRKVFRMYDDTMQFKSIQNYTNKETDAFKLAPSYYVYYVEQTSCLHESSVIAPNGTVTELVLVGSQLRNKDIVVIGGIVQKITIVSLAVAESIMRRRLFGIDFEEVRIK